MLTTDAIARLLNEQEPLENGTKELLHQVFVADKNYIVREPKEPYQTNELNWFISQSRKIKDLKTFAGFIPKIWKEIAEVDGTINSNYGWCCLSPQNGSQFENAMRHLELDKNSRRAIMVYNRPSMHGDWNDNRNHIVNSITTGRYSWKKMSPENYKKLRGDFMCCQNNHFIIRDDKLVMTVHMRSLDAVFGYNADYIWFDYIFDLAVQYLKKTYPNLERGEMVIYADSVHVYEMHYKDLETEASKDYGMSIRPIIKQSPDGNNKQTSYKPIENPYLKDPENNASVKDMVNHPDHYNKNSIEHWDYVDRTGLDYYLGCATKYLFRCEHKGTKEQDLDKALEYVDKFLNLKYPRIAPINRESALSLFHKLDALSNEVKDVLWLIDHLNATPKDYKEDIEELRQGIYEKVQELRSA